MNQPSFAHHGERLLYRVGEAAAILGIGKSKAWELISRGDLPSVKIDGARRVPRSGLESYVSRLGGSDAPAVLLERLGVDIRQPSFWQRGLGVLRALVDEAKQTAAEL